ncbi:MAG: RNA-binding S4 domain-containing protein [Dysgonamonadaceae bacterium]|jgi:23S rRNA pseudouridine2605 synthase|nr:RNA-binding S4 domain-containing protein [Dysgonamonadaceae bacterium]
MTTENEEWKPRNRYNDTGREDGQNRMKRPYQSYNRPNYGNQQNGGNYDRPRSNYSPSNNSGRNDYGNRENNYDRRDNGYNRHNQRSYDNNYSHPYDNRQSDYDASKKRRPRVGEAPNNSGYQQGGDYNNRDRRGGYRQQKPQFQHAANYKSLEKINRPNKYREEKFDPDELIRLNKYLANAGVCSRREADEFIRAGLVKVNGETVNELGSKVKRADEVTFHNEPVKLEQKVYVLLNKPKNCVTTTASDPQDRLTVMDLVKTACHERIFPVGRLDRGTTGVLLLTNDGDLTSKLTHPKYQKKKIYHVWLDKDVTVADMQKIAEGVELDDGEIHADAISYVTETDKDQVGVEIHSGRNRIVRRMFEALGYHVMKLDRVYFAGLTKKNLKRGHWRYLEDKEISMLKMGVFA